MSERHVGKSLWKQAYSEAEKLYTTEEQLRHAVERIAELEAQLAAARAVGLAWHKWEDRKPQPDRYTLVLHREGGDVALSFTYPYYAVQPIAWAVLPDAAVVLAAVAARAGGGAP